MIPKFVYLCPFDLMSFDVFVILEGSLILSFVCLCHVTREKNTKANQFEWIEGKKDKFAFCKNT